MQAVDIQFPRLPALDKADVKAVRSFLPGKALGRLAAVLAVVAPVLLFAGVVDRGLKQLDVDLSSMPWWLRFGLLLGLPLLVVISQLVAEWHAERTRRALQGLAVQPGSEQSGYFRIGPYLSTPEDRARFNRADRTHEKVLSWIERSSNLPLYLTGDSGSGKSSLLNSFVLPELRDQGWTVVEARVWQDPETALRTALAHLLSPHRSRQSENQSLQHLLATVARAADRLLLVLDQFEEFLILGKTEQQQQFLALIAELQANPIRGLVLLLVLRSDYQMLLDDLGLPPLRHGDNFYQVGRFTIAAATAFMGRSGLKLHSDTLDRLLISATKLDETPGLVRPITLNVVGYVLATGQAVAISADAGQLVRNYIELTTSQPSIRDFAPRVLEQLVTEQGTKQPRSEQEISAATSLRRGEVRAVLNGLADTALARPLDPINTVWELSHDFIARAVTRHLGRRRHEFFRKGAFYAAPALLATMLLVAGGVSAWSRYSFYETRSELAELGLSVTFTADGLIADRNAQLTPESFPSTIPLLAKLAPLQSLDLSGTEVHDLEPLKGLITLKSLNLNDTAVDSLDPLRGLTALQTLYLRKTNVANLEPLKDLTALQELYLGYTFGVQDIEPLRGLVALQNLGLRATQVANLEPLKGLTALQSLDLRGTKVANLEPLKGLTALQSLYLGGAKVDNLEPLDDLPALQEVGLNGSLLVRHADGEPRWR